MSTFEAAIPVILAHEGGWVANPADPGGETNYGISTLIVRRIMADEKLTRAQTAAMLGLPEAHLFTPGYMKPMQVQYAKAIYKKMFWDKYGYGQIADQTVATKIFDASVNCGPKRGGAFAQRAANKLGGMLAVDGVLGPKSFAEINDIDPNQYMLAYAEQMLNYYNDLVVRVPSLSVFLRNWTKRAAWGTK